MLIVKKHPLDLTKVEHSPGNRVRPAQAKAQAKIASESQFPADKMASTSNAQHSISAADTSVPATTTKKPAHKPLPQIPADRDPWSYDTSTGDILVSGEPLTGFERIIVSLVSRHPLKFKDADSFVREGEKPLSSWELELVAVARKFPVDLDKIADFNPERCSQPDQSQPLPQPQTENNPLPRKSLPEIPTDRVPWTTNSRQQDIFASGERLDNFERKIVLLASRYPGHFEDSGHFKAKGEPKLTSWERELVRAAKKFPIDLSDINEENHESSDKDNMPKGKQNQASTAKGTRPHSANDDFPSTRNMSSNAYWDLRHHRTQRMVPHPPRSYNPSEDFRPLKKRILSNAHAYYAHRFPKAERYDLITASTTPAKSLASVEWRAALIVYPDPDRRDWQLLYKSNPCPTVEDAAFEVKYWVEQDMWGVLDKMNEGATWVADDEKAGEGDKGEEKNDEGERMDGVEVTKPESEKEKKADSGKGKEKQGGRMNGIEVSNPTTTAIEKVDKGKGKVTPTESDIVRTNSTAVEKVDKDEGKATPKASALVPATSTAVSKPDTRNLKDKGILGTLAAYKHPSPDPTTSNPFFSKGAILSKPSSFPNTTTSFSKASPTPTLEAESDNDEASGKQLAVEASAANRKRKTSSKDEGAEERKKSYKISKDERLMVGDIELEDGEIVDGGEELKKIVGAENAVEPKKIMNKEETKEPKKLMNKEEGKVDLKALMGEEDAEGYTSVFGGD